MAEEGAYHEPQPEEAGSLDAARIVTGCVESGVYALLLDRSALPPAFFDLSSGFAGELLHRLGLYGIRMAAVVSDPSRCSRSFQDFVREANRGRQVRFFATRGEALEWLSAGRAG